MSAKIGNAVTQRRTRRGQPLVVLALIVSSWVGARALAWDGSGALVAKAVPS